VPWRRRGGCTGWGLRAALAGAPGRVARLGERQGKSRRWRYGEFDAAVAPGIGRALVETARGLLMHEIVLDGDTVADYFIVAPTEWNFHPQGPLAGWLLGREGQRSRGAAQPGVALARGALDPCVRWELEGYEAWPGRPVRLRATASATLMPSTAAERMPPA
jgi:hypothetical protein